MEGSRVVHLPCWLTNHELPPVLPATGLIAPLGSYTALITPTQHCSPNFGSTPTCSGDSSARHSLSDLLTLYSVMSGLEVEKREKGKMAAAVTVAVAVGKA